MKKIMVASMLAVVLLVVFVHLSNAEMAKEGTFSGTVTYAGSHHMIPLDKSRVIIVYENMGVRVSDSGEGPFHGSSTRNVGVIYYENGVGRLRGYIISIDKDGDKVLMELTEEASQMAPKPTSGTGEIVGGTGKFKGITGNMKYVRRYLRSIADGTHQAISKSKGTYKIVEPKK